MANSFAVSRAQLIYALCLPLAVLMGYFLADPTDSGSITVIVLVIGLLCVPVLIRWHHPLLILAWNAVVTPYFLPGQPHLWIVMAATSLLFAVLNRFTNDEARFTIVPSLTKPLLCLVIVILATALLRGGVGIKALGSTNFGGRNYFFIFAAVAGFFAFTSQRIPAERAWLYLAMFFLPGLTSLISNFAYFGGRHFDFLYYMFPSTLAMEQAMAEFNLIQFARISGLTLACTGLYCWLLAQYGLRGIFDFKKPWRLALLVLVFLGYLFSGFRSSLILFSLVLAAQLYFEGLFRTRLIVLTTVALALLGGVIVQYSNELPFVVQRSISFLPVDINPIVRRDVENSSDWRFDMWRTLWPDVPQYLLRGKGYGYDPAEMAFVQENARRGYTESYRESIISGNYHNGALSIVIPFGVWGLGAFIWFAAAAIRYLYRNYKRSSPALQRVNTFILAYFIARTAFFFLVYGGLNYDLYVFTGLIGLSVSLNGPEPVEEPEPAVATEEELAFSDNFASEQLQ
jgi:hypothetical protein